MNTSKKFVPKPVIIQPKRHNNVKIWGDCNRLSSKLSHNKSDKISKIFAPKLTARNDYTDDEKQQQKIINPNIVIDSDFIKFSPEVVFGKLNKKIMPKAKFSTVIKNNIKDISKNWWNSIKSDYYNKQWFRKLNYQLVAFDLRKNLNRLLAIFCGFGLVGFFVYLAIFDQYFTIKKYIVQYSDYSYLNNQQTFELVNHFQKNKLYRVFPNNQYWFANNVSLTASAKEVFPEINSVNIKNREWPDKVTLQVDTNKPLLTLRVNENNEEKYWRINSNGKVSSQDKSAIWYNLVKVEKPYSLQGENAEQLSLFYHSFENDPSQKQRFKLTKLLFDYFKSINLPIATTIFPSISDTDIIIESVNGTQFVFDAIAFEPDIQIERLDYFLKAKLEKNEYYQLEKKSIYSYFDFRIAYKVHLCKVTEKCNANNTSELDKNNKKNEKTN